MKHLTINKTKSKFTKYFKICLGSLTLDSNYDYSIGREMSLDILFCLLPTSL